MTELLTDDQIARLISEAKPLADDLENVFHSRQKSVQRQRDIDVQGSEGSRFRVIIRQSSINLMDFSVILAFYFPNTTKLFRLRRYNGSSHFHTNTLEHNEVEGFHIHQATERYQQAGLKEDGYAETSTLYFDLKSAIECLVRDCNFMLTNDGQIAMF